MMQNTTGRGTFTRLNPGHPILKGGKIPGLCDLCIIIPSDTMQIIEAFQLSITHALFTMVRHRIYEDGRECSWVQEGSCVHTVNSLDSHREKDFPSAR